MNPANGRGDVSRFQVYPKKSTGSDELEQTLPGHVNNKPTETSGSSGSIHTKKETDKIIDSGRNVHVETSNKSLEGQQSGIGAVLGTRKK